MVEAHSDIVVIGLGAMGGAALWRLAERGIQATGFERFQPGHDRGSSHGESRIFRTAYLEGSGYVPLAQQAIALWRTLQEVSGIELMTANGALSLGAPDSATITATMRSIDAYQLDHELLDAGELQARYPAQRVASGEVAIYEGAAGFLRPERAIRAAVGRAQQLGAIVHARTAVDRIELMPDGVRVRAGDLRLSARHAVLSPGAWLTKLMPELTLPVRVTRQIPGWFPITRPELFTPDRFPVFMRDIQNLGLVGENVAADSTFYGFPTLDGETIKISLHREGAEVDPDALDRTVYAEELVRVGECIREFLVGVSAEPVRTQVCMYSNTPDHDFLIGSVPGMPQLTILGGFSGHGFKFASVIGEVAADLATTGATGYPVDFLSPARFSAGAGIS